LLPVSIIVIFNTFKNTNLIVLYIEKYDVLRDVGSIVLMQ